MIYTGLFSVSHSKSQGVVGSSHRCNGWWHRGWPSRCRVISVVIRTIEFTWNHPVIFIGCQPSLARKLERLVAFTICQNNLQTIFVYLVIYLFIYLLIYLFIYLRIDMFKNLFICICIYLSIYLSVKWCRGFVINLWKVLYVRGKSRKNIWGFRF